MLVNTRISKCLACGGSMTTRKAKRKWKLAKGGKPRIHIKPSKRGSFTAWCKKKGYGGVTSKCISAGKNSSSSAIRKKATFAANARTWKKKYGGKIELAANQW